jgi:hypothetical protein
MPIGQGGAPGRGREDRGAGRGSGSPTTANLSGASAGTAEVQRPIPASSMQLVQGNERGEGEESRGYL